MAAKRFESKVSGTSAFPVDMLRYDRAWPTREQDSVEASSSIDRMHPRAERKIMITSLQPLTSSRWLFFGWTVDETRAVNA